MIKELFRLKYNLLFFVFSFFTIYFAYGIESDLFNLIIFALLILNIVITTITVKTEKTQLKN